MRLMGEYITPMGNVSERCKRYKLHFSSKVYYGILTSIKHFLILNETIKTSQLLKLIFHFNF